MPTPFKAIIYLVNSTSRFNLLWIVVLPFSVLALAMILDRPLQPRPAVSTGPYWLRLGTQAYNSGDMQRAVPLLSLAAAWQDLQPEGWIMLGDAYYRLGDTTNALEAWQNAGASTDALERMLDIHILSQDYPAAIADLQALIALQPEQADRVYQLGLLLAATQPEQAIPTLGRAAALFSIHKGSAQALQRRIQAAVPISQPAYTQLEAGRGLADLAEWELAAAAFRRASQLRPDYAEAWAFLGEALQHLDIPEGKNISTAGLAELEYALQLDPGSLSANLFLALYWRRQGQLSQAQEILEILTIRHPENAAIQIELGSTLAEKGDPKNALSHFVRATELAPTEPESWLALAGFSVGSQYQVRQVGLPAVRQLLLLTPADPAALDLMGQALLQLDDPLNAERFIRRAIQSDHAYSLAHLHLAQVYLLRSATAAARQELSLVIALSPGSAEAEFARRLLENMSP
jgi:tetratricopeptide (TPR) repeat protein